MKKMNPYLFVYGTLRKGNTNPFALYLFENARWLGTAQMPGLKVDLGEYPGAQYLPKSDQFVAGEVFEMSDPENVLTALDEYECIGPHYPDPHEFVRKECHIIFKNTELKCWVYLYNWPID